MITGQLVKITANRKLMVKIDEELFDKIQSRLVAACKKANFNSERLATFTLENDEGEQNYFVMVSLDRYDKQNMRKFEAFVKQQVVIKYKHAPYDFVPDGEEQQTASPPCQGINLLLQSIRKWQPKKEEELQEIDEIADKAAARAVAAKSEPLNAQEKQMSDELDVELAQRFPEGGRRRRTPPQ